MPFDFDAAVTAPFRMQPGLRRVAPGAPLLTPSRPGGRALREKMAVLATWSGQALLQAAEFDAAPARSAFEAAVARAHPEALRLDGPTLLAPALGWAVGEDDRAAPIDASQPDLAAVLEAVPPGWRRAALLALAFEQDFALLDAASGRIPWLAVALPSHWAPEDKVGRHFAEVHAPVADNRLLTASSDQLVRLVTGGERWERFVWTVTRHPRLHAHPSRAPREPWPEAASPDALVASAWFRTEHQTFVPLPGLGQAMFTIHVEVQPLAHAIDRPARAAVMADALSTMSEAVLAYRGLTEARDRLVAWLRVRAGALDGEAR